MNLLKLLQDNPVGTKPVCNLVRNGDAEATVFVYDIISRWQGIGSKEFIAALEQASGASTLHIRINSAGGDVFEGRAMVEAVKRFNGKTIAHVDSLAASAASSLAIAANEVEIAAGAFLMIHNASALAWGNKAVMLKTADLLAKVEETLVTDYVARTGKTKDQIVAWMDAETWFDGKAAVANGFCDRLAAAAPAATQNAWNLSAYLNAPAVLLGSPPSQPVEQPQHASASQINRNALELAMLT